MSSRFLAPIAFSAPKLLQVFENEGVVGLAGDRQADDEADDRHQQDVDSEPRLERVEARNALHELVFGQREIAHLRDLALDKGDISLVLGLDEDIGGGEARARNVVRARLKVV